jgi:FkbH-like protein/FkbM family methyltransferase
MIEKRDIAVAATFTAEPVGESLRYWLSRLALAAEIQFAPYNQPFQQLLDPTSLFARNRDGVNVLLIRFEDWMAEASKLTTRLPEGERERVLAGLSRFTLPGGIEVAHLNDYETEYLYDEIFRNQAYLKHGIALADGDCVIDTGANIGMFTMFVLSQCKNPRILSFEPSPYAHAALRANADLYGEKVTTYCCGVSESDSEARFTFYRKSSVFSGFFAEADQDRSAIRAVVKNVLEKSGATNAATTEAFADELMRERLESETLMCPLRSVSSVIRENGLERIDLLKIDAEKSELPVLRGIAAEDWDKIRQVVIEVHDTVGDQIREVIQMLESKGFDLAVEEEELLHGSGLYNVFAVRKGAKAAVQTQSKQERLGKNISDLSDALAHAEKRSRTPHLLFVCPSSPRMEKEESAVLRQAEQHLQTALAERSSVRIFLPDDMARDYPVTEYYDRHGDVLGHIPYTAAFFAGLGTRVAREIHLLQRPPVKVIVTDCDEVLWKGICGEAGAAGVELDEPRRVYQEFLVAQHQAGRLICLCSRNNEADVFEVFRKRPEMPLHTDHLAAWRVNWQPKSENIRGLSRELNLGLDSFAFFDDSPMECAEVRAGCPEILTLQLPADGALMSGFLKHVWGLEPRAVSGEDRQRTAMYRQNIEREQLRKQSLTLADFLSSLDLNVTISAAQTAQVPRIAQLTQRTNQFNCTTVRRTDGEVRELLKADGTGCLAIDVRDRFGDYGLVGVVIFALNSDALEVESFLLSCRVLGRGVEHQIVRRLGEMARLQGLQRVDIKFVSSAKNQPARDFLDKIGGKFVSSTDRGTAYLLPADYAASLTVDTSAPAVEMKAAVEQPAVMDSSAAPSLLIQEIAADLNTVPQIMQAIRAEKKRGTERTMAPEDEPRTPVEVAIAEVWSEVLGTEQVGLHEHFFNQLGGDSLSGTQVISRLCQLFDMPLPLRAIFEAPTVAGLSMTILEQMAHGDGESDVSQMLAELEDAPAEERSGD